MMIKEAEEIQSLRGIQLNTAGGTGLFYVTKFVGKRRRGRRKRVVFTSTWKELVSHYPILITRKKPTGIKDQLFLDL